MENNKLGNVIKPRRCLNNISSMYRIVASFIMMKTPALCYSFATTLHSSHVYVKNDQKNSMAGWISPEITCLWIFLWICFLYISYFLQFFVQNLTTARWKSSHMKWEQTVPLLLSDFLPHANIYYMYVQFICSYTKGVFLL